MKYKQFLLVEPISKTPYPPLGLMKISSALKKQHKGCEVFATVGTNIPNNLLHPQSIYITSLFTWDLDSVVKSINFFSEKFPRADIQVGGIAASLLPKYIESRTGISPHIGLSKEAEECAPDYSLNFERRINASITFASRGCPNRCRFCSVAIHEPKFSVRKDWEKDIAPEFPRIIFWDNNWLASPQFSIDCDKIEKLGKAVDFNQGLDARKYDDSIAKRLSRLRLDPIRFAFDSASSEKHVIRAIKLARKYSHTELRIYVLYNFDETPEEFYQRINLLNRLGALAFPMEYREATADKRRFPNSHWNVALLRALKLSLLYYYRRGLITDSRDSFLSIYGKDQKEFVNRLYAIYEYDKTLKRKPTKR